MVFEECTSLVSITLPINLSTIGYAAFTYCSSLISINLPDTLLESIGLYAFYNCTSLTSVILPNSLTTIGSGAFAYCSSLASITASYDYDDDVPDVGSNAFYGVASSGSVKNTGNIPSRALLVFLQHFGIPNDDQWIAIES